MTNKKILKPVLMLATLLLLSAMNGFAQARSLYWQSLDVQAQLDEQGRLHVIERQHMVFDGAWNGGERVFYLGFGHRLELLGMKRIDSENGTVTDMREGNLDHVDDYQLTGNSLRWRSRLPGNPVFRQQGIVYQIEYRLSNILLHKDGGYILDHDFAFSDRVGDIKNFSLELTLDPVWSAKVASPFSVSRQNLPPGRSVVVRIPLTYTGARPLATVINPINSIWLVMIIVIAVAFMAWRSLVFVRYEKGRERFRHIAVPGRIDDAWLEQNVFVYPAEKVGSLWDAKTGPEEVAALLARLVQEGKLGSRIEKQTFFLFPRRVLHLELRQPLDAFENYEKRLLKALFVDRDDNTTDTDRVRAHYKKQRKGFNPVTKIRSAMPDRGRTTQYYRSHEKRPWLPTLLLFIAGLLFLGASLLDDLQWLVMVIPFAVLSIFFGIGLITATDVAVRDVETPYLSLAGVISIYLVYATIVIIGLYFSYGYLPLSGYVGAGLLAMALFNSALNRMKTPVSNRRIRLRKQLCAVRRYFMNELKKPQPRLRDEWYPYLLAFGLDKPMEKWFRSFAADSGVGRDHFRSGSSSSSAGASGWSGGGGSFGGAGASGAWAAAAGSLSAGVSAPSSSGSSGGGGGSSGGGGGGGW
jgi:uncharacterized membrane protein YgcG